MKNPEITIGGEHDGLFIVVECSREQHGGNRAPTFHIGASEYPSRQAWEMRNDNAMIGWHHDKRVIAAVAPEAAKFLPMNGSWTDNGEPSQGVANAWYRLSGADATYEIEYRAKHGRANYGDLKDIEPRSEAWVLFFLGMACNILRCELHELSVINLSYPLPVAHEQYETFIDDVLRPRWQAEAVEANTWFDSTEGDTREDEQRDEPEWELTFDNGLKLRATLDEHYEGTPDDRRYWYYVTISAPDVKPYKAKWGGSQADYQDGRVSAREAALGTAKGLFDFQYEDAKGYVENMLGEEWDELPLQTRTAFERASAAFDRLENYLDPNREIIGS